MKEVELKNKIDELIALPESAKKRDYVDDTIMDEVFFQLGSVLLYLKPSSDIYEGLKKERDRYI